jgi:translation initiation factor IF-2
MAGTIKSKRLGQIARELNVGAHTIIEHLQENGFEVEDRPNTKLSDEMVSVLLRDFQKEKALKEKAEQITIGGKQREEVNIGERPSIGIKKRQETEEVFIKGLGDSEPPEAEIEKEVVEETVVVEEKVVEPEISEPEVAEPEIKVKGPKILGKIDLDKKEDPKSVDGEKEEEPVKEIAEAEVTKEPETEQSATEEPIAPPVEEEVEQTGEEERVVEKTKLQKLSGPKVIGKIDLPKPEEKKAAEKKKKPVASSSDDATGDARKKKRRRKRIVPENEPKAGTRTAGDRKRRAKKDKEPEVEISEKEIEEKLKETMKKISGGTKSKGLRAKRKKAKREEKEVAELESSELENKKLQVTEFISVAELASVMDVGAPDVIGTCMNLGIMVSINQRLDAEVIELVAEEYGFEVEFVGIDEDTEEVVEEDNPEDLAERAPIVTIMGHVDHGKTSLLDYIRSENVVAGEKGGITQHIGAYEVEVSGGKKITFLDTPGHEAFTAMRARGAKITDIVIIVIAADDNVMPQTKEAISHAQAAGVPMIFAINKVDKETANPEKIKEELAGMNLLVEDWGGKYQSQDISAKSGLNVDQLLEKVLLEAELLELKANPDKSASGSIIEASLDKGRGYVATILVQDGTLQVGDIMQAGSNMGKIKAMFNERGGKLKKVGPSGPAQILGLDGAPQAGEKFRVFESPQEAKQVAAKRKQIEHEQGMRAQKHITLDEIGRRLALGNFRELNIIIKGDVDGSVEALMDSLQKLSTEEIQISIVHKAVGQITESDVLLASASDAIIVGFQVRPSLAARKLAEKENVEIRLYSIIYNAIEEVKSAMEGMLAPSIEEKIIGNAEIREVFKISRIGTVAGCLVVDGKITRNNSIRVIRDGIVVYTGELASLKRFKDDVKEVRNNTECGLNVKDFNDIKVGDIIESFETIEVKRFLA